MLVYTVKAFVSPFYGLLFCGIMIFDCLDFHSNKNEV
jgi:hypothetical protein